MLDYRKLKVWQKSHEFVLKIYKATSSLPREEMYSLVSQIRRAAVSIPSNISEGCGRYGNRELKHFMSITMGSANEVEYQLLLAKDLGYIKIDDYDALNRDIIEIRKMLASYIKRIAETQ
jgi:four helix bundle protein